jgi:hypothetical protein
MSHGFLESDWKVFRELREVALERFCDRILSEAGKITSDSSSTAHARFLKLFEHVDGRNEELARAFDGPRRSAMLIQLATICSHDLLTVDEMARFSPETRETAESLVKHRS